MLQVVLIFLATVAAFALVVGLMAVGVLMGRREIRGSCGGLANAEDGSQGGGCSLCSNPQATCGELLRRSQGDAAAEPAANAGEACELDCQTQGCTPEQIAACHRH